MYMSNYCIEIQKCSSLPFEHTYTHTHTHSQSYTQTHAHTRTHTHVYSHTHTGTSFQRVYGDSECVSGDSVQRVVFCSGKIYYELLKERRTENLTDKVALVRIEQVGHTTPPLTPVHTYIYTHTLAHTPSHIHAHTHTYLHTHSQTHTTHHTVTHTLSQTYTHKHPHTHTHTPHLPQISPFPYDLVEEQLARYPSAEVVWVQEEPKNMGAWSYVQPRLYTATGKRKHIEYVQQGVWFIIWCCK